MNTVHPEQATVSTPEPAAACELRMHVGDVREMLFPSRLVHGDGSAAGLADILSGWGIPVGTAFVVSDRTVYEIGLLDKPLDSLRAAGWRVTVFSELAGEPTVAAAEAVVASGRHVGADVVVGFGGGSALDLAKVAALLLANDDEVEAYVGAGSARAKPARPLILVPTTAGTGAEATRVAVLSSPGGKRVLSHPSLVPFGAVLDALLLAGLPAPVTAATGMDALAHAVESSLSTISTPLTASMGLRAVTLLVDWLPRAFADPTDLAARRGTLYGAFLAGVALNAGVVVGHSMAYTVANRTNLPHGVTCAMALPYCLAFNARAVTPDVGAVAAALTHGRSTDLVVASRQIAKLAAAFDLPATPVEAGIHRSEQEPMARECGTVYVRPTNPVPMNPETLAPLYAAWFSGDLGAVTG